MTLETTTITGLPNASTPLTGDERVPMDQGSQTRDGTTGQIAALAGPAIASAITAHEAAADPHPGYVKPGDSPTFAGLTITGTQAVAIPHIHGSIAGNFYVHVRNDSGGQLTAGTAVCVSGSVGDTDRLRVVACDPTDPAKMPAIGILEATLAANGDGDAVILGELRPFNTSGYQLGDELYVGAGGALVAAVPASGVVQHVGSVARVQSQTGTIAVNIGAGMAKVGFTGAYSDLSGKPTLGGAAALDVGTTAGTVAAGDDARFTDAREWTASTVSQSEAETGTATTRRAWTAQRVFQAIAAWWAGSTAASKLAGIEAGAQVNVATDLSYTASTRLLSSSTGADVNLPEATTTVPGLQSAADKTKLDGIAAGAQVNVATNLSYTASTRVLASSTGDDATLPEATTTVPGLQSAADKTKLDGIAAGAEVNVQSDWNASSGDAQILNKPTLGTAAALDVGTGANNVVQLGSDAKLPAVDASQLTNVPGSVPAGFEGDIQLNLSGNFGVIPGFRWVGGELQVPGDIFVDDGVGGFTITIQCVTPTANRVQSRPDATGTYALVAGSSGQFTYNLNGAQAGSSVTFDPATGTRHVLPFGYGAGAGGTVTQATNKSTGVTLNTRCGQVTMNNAQLDAGTAVSFTLTNSQVAATDLIVVNHVSGGTTGAYLFGARAAAGSATITVRNLTAGNLSEAVVIAFAVIKATTN